MSGNVVPTKAPEKPIRRGNGYFIPAEANDGTEDNLPRVTTILNGIAKPHLIDWAAKMSAEYAFTNPSANLDEAVAVRKQILAEAGDRGSLVHSWAEALARGADVDPETVPAKFRGYARALVSWTKATKPTYVHTETVAVNVRYGYAGTLDGIIIDQAGRTMLVDYKTNNSTSEFDWALQLSAYLHADFLLTEPDRKRVEIPAIDEMGVVHLKDDGTWSWIVLPDRFHEFVAYLHIYRSSTKSSGGCRDVCWCRSMTE